MYSKLNDITPNSHFNGKHSIFQKFVKTLIKESILNAHRSVFLYIDEEVIILFIY